MARALPSRVRWFPLLLAACATEATSIDGTSHVHVLDVPQDAQPHVDVLVVVEDAASAAGIDAALAALPGGVPDLKIGVISGDSSALHGPVLTMSTDYDGVVSKSFAGSLGDALAPQLAVGAHGHALASARTALAGDFRRFGANLFVIILSTNNDQDVDFPEGIVALDTDAASTFAYLSYFQSSTLPLYCVPSNVLYCSASDFVDGVERAQLPQCGDGDARACYELLAPGYCASVPGTIELRVVRAAMPPANTRFHAECALP